MIKQECIGIPDMILLLMIFLFKKIKIKAEIVLSPGGAYFWNLEASTFFQNNFSDDLNNSDILFGSECKREI